MSPSKYKEVEWCESWSDISDGFYKQESIMGGYHKVIKHQEFIIFYFISNTYYCDTNYNYYTRDEIKLELKKRKTKVWRALYGK